MIAVVAAGALTMAGTATLATVTTVATAEPVLAASAPAPAAFQSRDGRNRRLRIHNQTGWTMTGFQTAEAGSRAWQADAASPQPVASGASWVAAIDDGSGACIYAFRAQFSNGQTLERSGINACEIADYYFTR